MTTYLTDRSQIEVFRRVRTNFFKDPFPPNTLLLVNGLAHPDYLVEIEAIADLSKA
jgi:enamine deaminase RidA (YjgF/YER057c/UK114 family)